MSPEAMVPQDHPLRAIKRLVDAALDRLSPDFAAIYASTEQARRVVGGAQSGAGEAT